LFALQGWVAKAGLQLPGAIRVVNAAVASVALAETSAPMVSTVAGLLDKVQPKLTVQMRCQKPWKEWPDVRRE
jgi:C4-type Zn-finger protein